MLNRAPSRVITLALAAVIATLAVGAVLRVGPLAGATPASAVTDPREMLARSLQATLDATAVHLEGTVSGTIPGRLVDRPEAAVSLDGSTIASDILPKDAKTSSRFTSPGLGVDTQATSVWDGVWFKTGPRDPWERASLGGASADAGVDINPLTLVERLRSYLATPGIRPGLTGVACASASGRCHRVTVEAGRDPAIILRALLPADRTGELPEVRTTVTVDTDVETLRPARLVVDAVSDDGSIEVRLELDASRWDDPGLVIEEPPAGG